MSLHFYTLEQCIAAPWKNGGGTTRELVCWPPGSSMSDFDWRISIADIDVNGPFSAFAGIDRTIMLLNGNGVQLTANDGSFDQRLDIPLVPFSFSGDTALDCVLLDGSTQDFNVMSRRGVFAASTTIVRAATQVTTTGVGLVFVASGQFDVQLSSADKSTVTAMTIRAGEGFWWRDNALHVVMTPHADTSALVMTQFQESK